MPAHDFVEMMINGPEEPAPAMVGLTSTGN